MSIKNQLQQTMAVSRLIGAAIILTSCLTATAIAAIQPGQPGFLGRETPSVSASAMDAPSAPKKFGDLNQDLVYTPITPCRIVDTRNTAAGAIAFNAFRSFVAFGISNFSSQGGSSSNCGTNPLAASAVNLAVTAITPTLGGSATLYAFGTANPGTTSISYPAGAVVTNTMVIAVPNPIATFDFTLATTQSSHYTIDMLGYFAPPLPTALQCLNSAEANATVAGGATVDLTAPACAAGYAETATQCVSASFQMPLVSMSNGVCSVQNNGATPAILYASRKCCRVPGRSLSALPCTLDVDRNGAVSPFTDGLLVLRYLFGLRGAALTTGAIGAAATLTADQIVGNIATLDLDADGDGAARGTTDGLLILRLMLGLKGAALTTGASAVAGISDATVLSNVRARHGASCFV